MTKTPGSIFFSDQILLVPTFTEVGLPEDVAMLGVIKGLASVGQWIDRGAPLVSATYDVFSYKKKRLWGLVSDPLWSHEVTLKSPVAGLVVGLRDELTTELQPWGVYYERRPALPIILMPRDEPPQGTGELGHYYREIGTLLQHEWRCLRFYLRGQGFIRLHEQVGSPAGKVWQDDLERLNRFDKPTLKRFETRRVSAKDTAIVNEVDRLRSQDLVLRDKLVHISRLANKAQ